MPEVRPYRRILALLNLDGSDERIARRAIQLARLNQASLAFLHLVEPDDSLGGGYPGTRPSQTASAMQHAAERRLAFLAAHLDAGHAECLSSFGPPARTFRQTLQHWQPDLVIAAGTLPASPGNIDCLIAAAPPAHGGKLRHLGQQALTALGLAAR